MATSTGILQQFQIPVPSFIDTLETTFVNDFIKVATVIAIIGIAAGIFASAPVLGAFSGLMLVVCLVATSALESAAEKQIAEKALKASEANTKQVKQELTTLKTTLAGIQENEPRNAALIADLETKIAEQATEIQRLTTGEGRLKEELQKANALAEQISKESGQLRDVITKLKGGNAEIKKQPVSTGSMFHLGGSARK